jgi:glycerophosphoryl diester phosphodiesterase
MTRHCAISIVAGVAMTFAATGDTPAAAQIMPTCGICAHRGASTTHPENTLASLREAIRLGAHMIEFDVALSRDREPILMHDATLDRTTDGTGPVANYALAELKRIDAGSWKADKFSGERIPTLDEALSTMPENVWLNIHIKGGERLAEKIAKRIVAHGRLHQAFIACESKAAQAARKVDLRVQICNMERRLDSRQYSRETIALRASFIQLLAGHSLERDIIRSLHAGGVRISFCCADDARTLPTLFQKGVNFVLVDDVSEMLDEAERLGIRRLQPVYRQSPRVQN